LDNAQNYISDLKSNGGKFVKWDWFIAKDWYNYSENDSNKEMNKRINKINGQM
jgi:hypothetical protein